MWKEKILTKNSGLRKTKKIWQKKNEKNTVEEKRKKLTKNYGGQKK